MEFGRDGQQPSTPPAFETRRSRRARVVDLRDGALTTPTRLEPIDRHTEQARLLDRPLSPDSGQRPRVHDHRQLSAEHPRTPETAPTTWPERPQPPEHRTTDEPSNVRHLIQRHTVPGQQLPPEPFTQHRSRRARFVEPPANDAATPPNEPTPIGEASHTAAPAAEAAHRYVTALPTSAARPPDTAHPDVRRRRQTPTPEQTHDLRHHGDAEVGDGLVDLAVNVRSAQPPTWLRGILQDSLFSLAKYPDPSAARAAIAERHGVPENHILVTSGATEAFTLIARALQPQMVHSAAVVVPQFTEPERAAVAAGHRVRRVYCWETNGFRFDPATIPEECGLVFIGNPTNPTGVIHPAQSIAAALRPERVVVVDEAFMDAIPGEPHSLAGAQLPGLLVVRSLTKMLGLAGLRIGYVIGEPQLIELLEQEQSPWSVNSVALAAAVACVSPTARDFIDGLARTGVSQVALLHSALQAVRRDHTALGLTERVQTPFMVIKVPHGEKRRALMRERGWAIRGCGSFPGLDSDWWRVAARDHSTTMKFISDLDLVLTRAVTPSHNPG